MEALKRVALLVEQKSRRIFLTVIIGNIDYQFSRKQKLVPLAKKYLACLKVMKLRWP